MRASGSHTPDGSAIRGRPGGVRTSILTLVTLAVLAAVVVLVLVKSVNPPDNASSPMTESAPDASLRASAGDGMEISGTITIAPELAGRVHEGSVLFIVARKGPGPPFAVKRVSSPRFPLTYRIRSEDVMLAGSPFEGEVRMNARLSRTGSAGPPQAGDLEGEHPVPVRVGARNVNIAISRPR